MQTLDEVGYRSRDINSPHRQSANGQTRELAPHPYEAGRCQQNTRWSHWSNTISSAYEQAAVAKAS